MGGEFSVDIVIKFWVIFDDYGLEFCIEFGDFGMIFEGNCLLIKEIVIVV